MVQWRTSPKWYAFALVPPFAITLVAAYVNVLLGAPDPTNAILAALPMAIPYFALMMLNPLQGSTGEEPGWRGIALPRMLEAVAWLLTEVVRASPGVRVIATSREPLSVTDEHVLPIPPLELPPVHAAEESLDQVRQNEAVALSRERAAAASGTFELTASNQAAVVDLCRRLDGLPLAIELAAVRTRDLTVEQMRDRLTDRFALLTGGSRAALPGIKRSEPRSTGATISWTRASGGC
jgi:hypothetical protein